MSSGFGEIIFTSTIRTGFTTAANYTMTGTMQFALDNTLLLYIILVVCAFILILLLCAMVFFCLRWMMNRKRRKAKATTVTNTFLISKSTSMTGLNDDSAHVRKPLQTKVKIEGNCEYVNLDDNQQTNLVPAHKTLHMHQKLITSTPTVKSESDILRGGHGALMTSPQSTICENDTSKHDVTQSKSVLSYSSVKPNCVDDKVPQATNLAEQCQTPNRNNNQSQFSHEATGWETGNNALSPTGNLSPTSNLFYGTAKSNLFSEDLNHDNVALIYDNHEENVAENQSLLPPDNHNFLQSPNSDESPNGVSTSLPLDAFGHPRAWFVPLDGLYHEPLRHSFIDVSSRDMENFTPDYPKKDCAKFRKSFANKFHSPTTSPDNENDFQSVFDDKEDTSGNWRDSGVPISHINVRSSNSSESESKKASAWEQREHRPVLFIEKQEGAVAADS